MKSVLVIYYPLELDMASKEEMKKDFDGTSLKESFEVLVIKDPSRSKVEVEVFFKPEKL